VAVKSSSVVTENPSKTKVSNLELSRAADEQIGWLQVTMHYVVVMAECYTL